MAKPPGKSFNSILTALRPRTRRPPDSARRERTLNSILIALSAGGVALVLLREINYGVGLGSDSRDFVATARSLLEGNGFTTWDGELIAKNAPLFPAILAFFGLLSLKVITVGAFLNAIAFGVIVLTTTAWLKTYIESRFLIIWSGLAITLWVPLADLSAILMTDTLFIALTVLSLYTLDRFLTASNRPTMMIISAVYASLAWLTRYQGVALVAAALLLILMQQGFAPQRKIKHAAVYAAIAGTPMAGWIIRNLIATGTFAGSREGNLQYQDPLILDSITSELIYWILGDTGSRYMNTLSETWFGVTETGMSIPGILSKTVILLAVALVIGYAFIYSRRRGYWENSTTLAVPIIFAFLYILTIAIPPLIQYEGIYVRYLTPLYVPMLVVIAIILDKFFRQISSPRYMPVVITVILSLWLIQSIPENYTNIKSRIENGFGAASKTWAKNETIRHIRSNPLNGKIYSTSHWVMYLRDVCINNCTLMPIQYLWDQDGKLIEHVLDDEPLHIVVLHHDDYYSLLMELSELATLEIVSIHLDGVIMKPAADSANNKKEVLTRDVVRDMILLTPDRLDGRSVLERYPLER